MELFFRALADKTRMRALNLLGDDEVCVCFLVETLQMNQPKLVRVFCAADLPVQLQGAPRPASYLSTKS